MNDPDSHSQTEQDLVCGMTVDPAKQRTMSNPAATPAILRRWVPD